MILPDPVVESLKRLAPDMCVCFVADGGRDLVVAGVTDYATAQDWRKHDEAHRAIVMFAFGKLHEDLNARKDKEEAQMSAPLVPEQKMPKRTPRSPLVRENGRK